MALNSEVDLIFIRQEKTQRRIGTAADYVVGGNFNIFQIVGGPISITWMMGHVTNVFAGVATPLITFTSALSGAASNMCTVAGAVAWPLNTLLVWTGLLAGALIATATIGHSQAGLAETEMWNGGEIRCVPGTIGITNAGGADATGVLDWYLSYIPLTPISEVVIL